MKYVLIVALLLLSPVSAYAWDNCGTPKAEPDCPEFMSPTATPYNSIKPSPTAEPTVTPTSTPNPTQTPVQTVTTTNTSDGRSDGRKDALDCVPESKSGRTNCNTATAQPALRLPTTAGEFDMLGLGIFLLSTLLLGVGFKLVASSMEKKQ